MQACVCVYAFTWSQTLIDDKPYTRTLNLMRKTYEFEKPERKNRVSCNYDKLYTCNIQVHSFMSDIKLSNIKPSCVCVYETYEFEKPKRKNRMRSSNHSKLYTCNIQVHSFTHIHCTYAKLTNLRSQSASTAWAPTITANQPSMLGPCICMCVICECV